MINDFPGDFNPIGYDIQTVDGNIWHFEATDTRGYLVCGDMRQELMLLDDRITLFAPGYRNINLHGFDVAGEHYELESAVRNANWTEPVEPDPEPADVPVHYSKLALCRALTSMGMWDGIKAAIVNAGKWDEFLLAQDLSEDDPDFVAMKQAMSELFPVEADEILRQCQIQPQEDQP